MAHDLPRWWPAWLQAAVFKRCAFTGHDPCCGPYLTKRFEIPSSKPIVCAGDQVLLEEYRCRCGAVRRLTELEREPLTDLQMPAGMWRKLERAKILELSRVRL